MPVIPFRPGQGTGSGSSSGGPEDPMFEQRVAVLEGEVSKIKTILERLETKITEILLTGAKQVDLHKAQVDVAELKGRFIGLEGKLGGLEGRFAALPTTWTILGLVFTTWALGPGLLIFTLTRLLGK